MDVNEWMGTYETLVLQAQVVHPHWRKGQAYFNVLAELNPDLAATLNPLWDPFHDDNQIGPFLSYVHAALTYEAEQGE